jgi:hypothetical protein
VKEDATHERTFWFIAEFKNRSVYQQLIHRIIVQISPSESLLSTLRAYRSLAVVGKLEISHA